MRILRLGVLGICSCLKSVVFTSVKELNVLREIWNCIMDVLVSTQGELSSGLIGGSTRSQSYVGFGRTSLPKERSFETVSKWMQLDTTHSLTENSREGFRLKTRNFFDTANVNVARLSRFSPRIRRHFYEGGSMSTTQVVLHSISSPQKINENFRKVAIYFST